jgi:hypothetical protein
MKAIIIEEERFAEIAALLKAKCTEVDTFTRVEAERLGIPADKLKPLLDSMFRTFNYEFVRWAQSHGASCVR